MRMFGGWQDLGNVVYLDVKKSTLQQAVYSRAQSAIISQRYYQLFMVRKGQKMILLYRDTNEDHVRAIADEIAKGLNVSVIN